MDAETIVARVAAAAVGTGLDARSGELVDMLDAGLADPVEVTLAALRNAASMANLILTADTLIADRPDYVDPTAGPATGGGAEKLGLS